MPDAAGGGGGNAWGEGRVHPIPVLALRSGRSRGRAGPAILFVRRRPCSPHSPTILKQHWDSRGTNQCSCDCNSDARYGAGPVIS